MSAANTWQISGVPNNPAFQEYSHFNDLSYGYNRARLAFYTLALEGAGTAMEPHLLSRHFRRKHGPGAYYGQAGRPKP